VPAPDDDRLERLSEALAQLVRRQRELEDRVRALESHAAQELPAEPASIPPPLPQIEPLVPLPSPDPLPSRDSDGAVSAGTTLETTFGLNWINRIAVLTLLLGVAFLFKYGVDNDWFGPVARVALGIAAALVALFAGHRIWRRGQTIFAQGIIGLGLALIYLSIYASAMLYHFLLPGFAFLAMFGVTAGAAGLALFYDSQAIAALAMVGGYITPPALSTGEDHPWILFGYVFLLNLGGLALARKRRWNALEPLAAGATILLYAGWFGRWFSTANRPVATVYAVAYYVQFSVATQPELLAIFQFGASIALGLIWQEHAQFLWWNLVLAAGGLAVGIRRSWAVAPLWALLCYFLPFWLWYSPDASFAAISAAFVIFFAWTFWRAPAQYPGLALVAANAALYYSASYRLVDATQHQYMGLLAVSIGGAYLLLARRFGSGSDACAFTIGVALAFLTLAVPIQFAGFRVTIAWALEGAALAWLSARFYNRWLRASSWLVLGLAFIRLFLLDISIYSRSSEYTTLANARFLTFAASTAALWLAARAFRPSSQAAITYIAGTVTLLSGLGFEIGGWVNRNIAPEDQSGVQIVAISVMLTLYAVILVIIGVRTRAFIHRMVGLALVTLVIAKLYLLDVWVLGRLFRITAFLALGVLLLGLSYLYSRFRPALARFLQSNSAP
jgi:hypothetical protein